MKLINEETGEITYTSVARRPGCYDTNAASEETATHCEEETRTQQQFKDECDINIIMERFGITGELPTNVRQPIMADFIDALDYQSAMNAIRAADEAFMEMPAGVRARFQNNPQNFIEFFSKEENRAEGEKLGLIMPKTSIQAEALEGVPEATDTPKDPA